MNIFRVLKIDDLVENLVGFIETKFELIKIDMFEGLKEVLSKLIYFIIFLFAIFFSLFFIGMALGIFINEHMDSSWIGFAIVGGINLTLLFVLYVIRKSRLFEKIAGKLLNKTFFDQVNKDDSDE